MRIAHLADLHLGFRQYQRLTPAGINQRETDVARAFDAVVDKLIALEPDAIVIGGDIFHSARPSNTAILHAYNRFHRLATSLPRTPVVMVGGNHDMPRTEEAGCILNLFRAVGVHVAAIRAEYVHLPGLELSVLAVPDAPGARPALLPDPRARHNVLLLHGEVEGMLGAHATQGDRAVQEIPRSELGAGAFDYVALGHYHVHRQIEPNAYYSGSIDYTSTNPWGEIVEQRELGVPGKGFVIHDLATGTHEFHPLKGRRFVSLPAIDARGMSETELDRAIAERVASCDGGIDDSVVRLIVRDVPPHVVRRLDYRSVREFKRRALHFHLDTRRPEILRAAGGGSPGRRPSLVDTVREKLASRVVDASIDRARLVDLGLRYLQEADAVAAAANAPEALDS